MTNDQFDYKLRVKELSYIYEVGMKIINAGREVEYPKKRSESLQTIIAKALQHCRSIIVLIKDREETDQIDFALIASAARNTMDLGRIYFYLSERGLSKEESNFRWNLQLFNYVHNMKKIMEKLGISWDDYDEKMFGFPKWVINELEGSDLFQNATKQDRKKIKSGEPVFNKDHIGLLSEERESLTYNILSNSIHGYYIGLSNYNLSPEYRYNSPVSFIMLFFISLEITIIYLSNMLYDHLLLRRQLFSSITINEREELKSLKSPDLLNSFYDFWKKEAEKPSSLL